jgi:hypothetical protein
VKRSSSLSGQWLQAALVAVPPLHALPCWLSTLPAKILVFLRSLPVGEIIPNGLVRLWAWLSLHAHTEASRVSLVLGRFGTSARESPSFHACSIRSTGTCCRTGKWNRPIYTEASLA